MKHWTLTLQEADDGSGDLILPLPTDLLNSVGWSEGTLLEWENMENGSWVLRKKEDDTSANTSK
jgi:hypothetical protein